jgi:probable rRNA maturation factor
MPSLELVNRQRKKRLDLVRFRAFALPAMEKVSEMITTVPLPEEIIVVFVSDAKMEGIHREFMAVEGPTDVITFQHGEIIISVETADRQAKGLSSSFNRELRLYFVHGLLHLAGLDDLTEDGFTKMAAAQEQIVRGIGEVSEPGARSQEPGAGSREPGAGSTRAEKLKGRSSKDR